MEKDKGTPVKCKEIMKRQTYVKTKMKLMKVRQIILKHNKKSECKGTRCATKRAETK